MTSKYLCHGFKIRRRPILRRYDVTIYEHFEPTSKALLDPLETIVVNVIDIRSCLLDVRMEVGNPWMDIRSPWINVDRPLEATFDGYTLVVKERPEAELIV